MYGDALAGLDRFVTVILGAQDAVITGGRLTRQTDLIDTRLRAVTEQSIVAVAVEDTFSGSKAAGLRVTDLVDAAERVIGFEEALSSLLVTAVAGAVGVILTGDDGGCITAILDAPLNAVTEETVVAVR